MQVYHAGNYGRANLMVRPGMHEPTNDSWFRLETDERGELRRIAHQFLVSFEGGAAEVDDELGRYLLEKELVSAAPQPFAQSAVTGTLEEVFPPAPPRKPPIAVGQTMTPAAAASQARFLGERLRG